MKDEKPNAAADQAATEQVIAQAREEGAKEGTKADRERIQKILGSEEAKTRSTLAHHLALETDMSAEAAIALLAKSAPEASGKSPLKSAMEATGTPGITSPNPPEGDDVVVRIDSAKIYESRRKAARS